MFARKMRGLIALVCVIALVFGCIGCGKEKNDGGESGKKGGNNTEVTPTVEPTKGASKGESKGESKELTGGSSATPADAKAMDEAMRTAYETFAFRLFNTIEKSGTRMISPFSIYTCFGMLANGANDETLRQIDAMLGLTDTERNAYLASWIEDLVKEKQGTSFSNADSIWIKESLESYVPKAFLDTCAQYYKASVFSTGMDDKTIRDVNEWVKKNTKNMIAKILEDLSPDASMILVNAVALEAKWVKPFESENIRKDYKFTLENGTTKNVEMMFGEAEGSFLENELATGFTKKYMGDEFSYVALLPKEGVSIAKLVESLKPGIVRELWRTGKVGEVHVGVPKYQEEFSLDLNDVLQSLGMSKAFDPEKAEFKRLMDVPNANTFVSKAIHKTFISVDNEGTRAAAVTAVIMDLAMAVEPTPSYRVVLDRPFVYMIVDSDGMPIFLGTYEG
jgi:Serine protease inhibitor